GVTTIRRIEAQPGPVMGYVSTVLRIQAALEKAVSSGTVWARNARSLAARLRRAQTFLRTLGIEITFSREGRTGTRMIRVSTNAENTVTTVSIVSAAHYQGGDGRCDHPIFDLGLASQWRRPPCHAGRRPRLVYPLDRKAITLVSLRDRR